MWFCGWLKYKKDIVADLLLDELEAEYGDCDTDYFNEDDEDLFDVLDEYPLEEIDLLSLSPTIKESKPKHMPMPRCAEKIEEKPKYCKKIENGPRYSKVKKK